MTAMSFYDSTGTYNPSHHVQSFSSSANVEQEELSVQNIPPAPIDFLNWDDSFHNTRHSYLAQPSATLPIQASLSAVPVLPQSYLDIFANSSRTLPVAAPVPVPHAALTKAALRTMMLFDDKDKENETHNNNSAGGSEPLKIFTDARTRVDFDNHGVLHPNAMNYNALVNSGNNKQTTTGRSKLVIRPISPSTLIALTEPCLMAWCTASDDSDILAEPGSSAYLPLQTSDHNNHVDKAVYNAWGY